MQAENGSNGAAVLGFDDHESRAINVSLATQGGSVVGVRPGLAEAAPVERTTRPAAPARSINGAARSPADVLDRAEFSWLLEREKRRVERTKTPLSLVLFRIEPIEDAKSRPIGHLLDRIAVRKRETDSLAYLDDGVVAALLPDTEAIGAARFARGVAEHIDDWMISGVSATYPDSLFDHITHGKPSLPTDRTLQFAVLKHGPREDYRLKRMIDVTLASAALLLLAPLMLLTAMAIASTSRGPVIFKQVRLGRGGEPFVFYKFRSMAIDADDSIHRRFVERLIDGQVPAQLAADSNAKPMFKLAADPRVTWIGKWIRKSSIDELPQLFNVLKGDMSLVGPRPPIPYEAARYQAWHLRRVLDLRPGITGLWQVEGRSRVSFDDMVRMDIQYIRQCSLALDLSILLRTVKAVLRGDGAS